MASGWSEGGTYLADTLVVKETHSLTNVNGVVPVMSSHCAGVVPPETTGLLRMRQRSSLRAPSASSVVPALGRGSWKATQGSSADSTSHE